MSERPEQTAMSRLTRQQNEVMLKLFRTAYCVVKHNFSLCSFPALIDLQECNGLNLGRAYRNRMAASSFVSFFLQMLHRVQLYKALILKIFFLTY